MGGRRNAFHRTDPDIKHAENMLIAKRIRDGMARDRKTAQKVRNRQDKKTVSRIGKRDKWTCYLCNGHVDKLLIGLGEEPMRPSLDHIKPTSMGGTDHPDNLRLAHAHCNSIRGVVNPNVARRQIARGLNPMREHYMKINRKKGQGQ